MLSQEAIEHLEVYGYCLIEDAIPTDRCDQMAEKYFQLHQDPDSYPNFQSPGEIGGINQTLFGTVNRDEMCWDCIAHPHVLEVVRHFLGPKARLGEVCTKWIKPGAPMAGIHVDSTHDLSEPFPDVPWLINSMWMITDFTVENGATVVVPMSHKSKRRPVGLSPDDKRICSIAGRRGSVMLWHGGAWHTSGANISQDHHRIGLNIAYYPAWWNCAREGGHQPVFPEVFERMPREVQDLCRYKVGRHRSEVYEF